jgi:5-methylcytosine-specific restriction endonuclease McrA
MKKLIKKLDERFSIAIRLAESAHDLGKCFICRIPIRWDHAVAGHFRKRRHLATRWSVENVHMLCPDCNRIDEQKPQRYEAAMIQTYGKERIKQLVTLSNREVHWTKDALKKLLANIEEEIKQHEKDH